MSLRDYYNHVRKLTRDELAMEMDCIEHYYEAGGKEDYSMIADICTTLSMEGIIDIGCAYGHQSEVFLKHGLKYHGIDNWCHAFWNSDESGISYQTGQYPCEITVNKKNMLPVSRLCLGFELRDYAAIARDFDLILTDAPKEGRQELSKYFMFAAEINGYFLFVKKEKDHDILLQTLAKK